MISYQSLVSLKDTLHSSGTTLQELIGTHSTVVLMKERKNVEDIKIVKGKKMNKLGTFH